MDVVHNYTPLWRIHLLLVFTSVTYFAASGLALDPVSYQNVQKNDFQYLKSNNGEPSERRWKRDLGFTRSVSAPSKSLTETEHQTNTTDKIFDSTLIFGTVSSIPTPNVRVKRNVNDALGATASTRNGASGNQPALSAATVTETASELPETTASLAPTTEVRWSSESSATETTLTSSLQTLATSSVSVSQSTTSGETTTDASVCPKISAPIIITKNATEVTILWNLTPEKATNFRNTCVEVVSVRNDACEDYRHCFTEQVFEENVHNLCHSNEYIVSISVECETGNWTNSTAKLKTKTIVPSEPTDFGYTDLTNTSVILTWSAPASHNDGVIQYTVYWEWETDKRHKNVSNTSYTLEGLNPFTEYSIFASAWTTAGEGKKTEPIVLLTKDGIPTEPTNLQNETVTSTTILMKWSPPISPNGNITHYMVYWTPPDSEKSNLSQTTTYLMHDLKPDTNYSISVSAWTSAGESEKRAGPLVIQTKEGIPGPPREPNIIEVSNNTLTLQWLEPSVSNGVIIKYSVYWKKPYSNENNVPKETNETTLKLESLMPYTSYTLKVSAWTVMGEGPPSEEVTRQTKEGIPDPPEDVEFSDVSNETLTLKWSPPRVIKGVITNYSVYWKILDSSDNYRSDVTHETTMQLKNLEPFTNYTAKVSAWTVAGEGKASDEKIEQTKEGIPDPPEDVEFSDVSNETLTLKWSPPRVIKGVITNYSVYWKILDSSDNYRSDVTHEMTMQLKNLEPFTNYTAKVSAWTVAGEGKASDEKIEQTKEGIPDPPEDVEFSDVSNETLTLKWSPPRVIKGVITNYSVYWKILDSSDNYRSDVTHETTMQLKNLEPFTNYTAKVSSWTVAGEGKASDEKIEQTKEGNIPAYTQWASEQLKPTTRYGKWKVMPLFPAVLSKPGWYKHFENVPGPPLNLKVRQGTNVSVSLSWSPPSDPNGDIVKYYVSWSSSVDNNVEEKTTNDTFFDIIGLIPYVNYTLSVSARTSAGRGATSVEKRYRTDVGVPSKPKSVSIIDNTPDTLILRWEKPEEPRGPIDGYIISWKQTEEEKYRDSYDTKSGNVLTYEVKELTPFTKYMLGVTPYNRNQKKEILKSEDSTVIQAETAQGVPTAPTDFHVEAFTDTTFNVTWQDPETPNGIILCYTVYWQSDDDTEAMNPVNTTGTKYVISDLNSFTKYSLTVSATTIAGEGPTAPEKIQQTDVGVPSAPQNGTVLDVNDTTVLVEWRKPAIQHGPIHGFIMCWRKFLSDVESNATFVVNCQNVAFAAGESCVDFNPAVMELFDDSNATVPACQYLITNLDPWTNYSIDIKAYNENQYGNVLEGQSEMIQQATEAAVPQDPVLAGVQVLSSTSVSVSWKYTGRFPGPLSYAIYLETDFTDRCTRYYQRNITESLKNETANITDLKPFTYYSFGVYASTAAGSSYSRNTSRVRTRPDVPERPRNLKVNCSYSPTKAYVSWETPAKENGLIEEYKIKYWPQNSEQDHRELIRKVDEPKRCVQMKHQAELENLRPEKMYEISVMGKTKDVPGYGQPESNKELCFLPAGVPPFPKNDTLPNITEINQQEAKFAFSQSTFSTEMGRITYYAIIIAFSHVIGEPTSGSTNEANSSKLPVWNEFWKQEKEIYQATPENWNPFQKNDYDPLHCQSDPDSEELLYCTIGWEKNCSEEKATYCNGPLKPGKRYGIKLRGFTAGGFSETIPIYISTAPIETGSPVGTIFGVLFLFLFILVLAVLVFLDKRNNYKIFHQIRNYFRNTKSTTPGQNVEVGLQELSMAKIAAKTRPMNFTTFLDHVKVMMSDSFLRFSLEYEEIKQNSPKFPCTAAEMEENRMKNRWMNIFPFDHSRVKILPIDDEPGSDYINANYIPGFTSHREYIATQGPLPNTVDDFWRMVWEQGVTMIVMLTQCIERGKKKCEEYWPSDSDSVYYGDLKIQLKSESILSAYCIRIFDLQLGTKQHTVKQMHFTKWPDFGCPESPQDLINFVQAVRDHLPHTNTGPILIHCSAGVGRTGTFIAVDRLLQHIQYHNGINIYNTAIEMRQYRTNMVQTEDQYVYIHKCMRDIISQKLNPRGSIYDDDDEERYENLKAQQAIEL